MKLVIFAESDHYVAVAPPTSLHAGEDLSRCLNDLEALLDQGLRPVMKCAGYLVCERAVYMTVEARASDAVPVIGRGPGEEVVFREDTTSVSVGGPPGLVPMSKRPVSLYPDDLKVKGKPSTLPLEAWLLDTACADDGPLTHLIETRFPKLAWNLPESVELARLVIAAEREACAAVANSANQNTGGMHYVACEEIAADIRARGRG